MANKNIKTNPKVKPQSVKVNRKYSTQRLFIYLGIIVLLTILVFSNSIRHEFLTWDDNLLVPENPDIKGISLQYLKTIFTSYYIGMYQPLTTYSYALINHFYGLNPYAFHTVSLIFHLVNVALVFYLIYLVTQRAEAAIIVSLFFAIHPMHVESVVWIAEFKDILYTLFFIGTLCCYVLFIKNKSSLLYAAAILLFILSCLSKSAAVTLPVVLLVLDYYYGRKFDLKVIAEKIAFFAISVTFGIIAIKSQSNEKAIVDITPLFTIVDRFFLVCYSTSFYIVKLFLPFKLSTLHYYPLEHDKPLPILYYLSPLVPITLIMAVIISKKYRKLLIFGLLFFLINIALVLQIIPVGQAIVSERYTYVPYIGLLFIIAKIYCDAADNKLKNSVTTKQYFTAILVIVALFFSYLTYERNKVWKDTITLFTDVINNDPTVFYSYTVRGGALILKKQYREGIEDYETSIKLQPNYYDPYFNIGKAYYFLGDYKRAISYYSKSIELKPDFAEAYSNRAAVLFNTGNIQATIDDCNKAISLKPKYADAYVNRGNAKGMLKDYQGSIDDFNKGIELKNDLPEAYLNRGLSKVFIGRQAEGCEDFKMAFSLGDSAATTFIRKYCK